MSVGAALVISTDSAVIRQFSHALQEFSIAPDVCRELATARHLLNHRKFEAVIVDLQLGQQAATILDDVRLSPSNRTSVTFLISQAGGCDSTLRARSLFVFERPVSPSSIRRTLKPACGLILRGRRRYFRCPIELPVVISRSGVPPLRCQSINLSEGGMALSTSVPLRPGDDLSVEFTLPGYPNAFLAEATVCWWKTGHLGLRFIAFPQGQKPDLQTWLAEELEKILPEFVAAAVETTAAV